MTLIILHGWQSSKEKWQRVKEDIEKSGIEVLVPDLPGFKSELALEKGWNLDDYIDWFNSFSKDLEKFFLLGHSFGGRIAIKFASKYSERIKGLILVSAAGLKPKKNYYLEILTFPTRVEILKRIFSLPILSNFYSLLREIFYRYILRKTDYLKAKGAMKETFKKIIEEDLTPLLAQIQTPTLIIWGNKDKITPLKDAYFIKEKIKNSKLEILENVGHAPHLETPEKLSETILRFLESRKL